jgi:hypothetical protein
VITKHVLDLLAARLRARKILRSKTQESRKSVPVIDIARLQPPTEITIYDYAFVIYSTESFIDARIPGPPGTN